jgi:hypothetical protein
MRAGKAVVRTKVAAVAALGSLGLAAPGSAQAKRFEGYVGGVASGKGHKFFVGDCLYLVFVDRRNANTAYRVCWHRLHHSHHRCWIGETGARGRKDRIFTAAPPHAGPYVVKWTVRHRRKAVWSFTNGVGD